MLSTMYDTEAGTECHNVQEALYFLDTHSLFAGKFAEDVHYFWTWKWQSNFIQQYIIFIQ